MLFRSDRKSTRLNSSHTIISYALPIRSEEHTSELQSHDNLVCRLLLEKKTIRSEEHTSELKSHDNLVCRLLLEKKRALPRPPAGCSHAARIPRLQSCSPPPRLAPRMRRPTGAFRGSLAPGELGAVFFLKDRPPPESSPFPYTTLLR